MSQNVETRGFVEFIIVDVNARISTIFSPIWSTFKIKRHIPVKPRCSPIIQGINNINCVPLFI